MAKIKLIKSEVNAAQPQKQRIITMSTNKLRLGPLPSQSSIKLTFSCPAGLKADLDRYVELHAQTYGKAVDAATLIPNMLEAFMAGDRGFKRIRIKTPEVVGILMFNARLRASQAGQIKNKPRRRSGIEE